MNYKNQDEVATVIDNSLNIKVKKNDIKVPSVLGIFAQSSV